MVIAAGAANLDTHILRRLRGVRQRFSPRPASGCRSRDSHILSATHGEWNVAEDRHDLFLIMEIANRNRLISLLIRLKTELGVDSILNSPRDTKILCLQRFVRLFAYGTTTLILALYLSSLDISEARIGLFMTLTLLGDVVISFGLTLFADRLGRRKTLIVGAVLMSASGFVFAFNGNYWILVAASILGVISPRLDEFHMIQVSSTSSLKQNLVTSGT